MKIKALNSNEVEVFLYGYIGDDITASEFLTSLRQQEETYKTILIRINSVGGDMFEGIPMYNHLKASKAETIGIIDGLAASMATIVMCGCKTLKAASNAKIMVHGPRGGDYDTVEKLETVVETMKSMRADMAKVYAARTGKSEKWIMDNWLTDGQDHWFTADEAKNVGLIDEVISVDRIAASTNGPLKLVAAFYDKQLSNNSHNPNNDSMKKLIALLNATKLVALHDTAPEGEVEAAIGIVTAKLSVKDQEITQKDAEITRLKKEAADAKTAGLKDRATTMVEAALSAKKIVADQKESYITLASASEEGYTATKHILDKMKGYTSVNEQLKSTSNDAGGDVLENLSGKSKTELAAEWDKRHKEGTLASLKSDNKEAYDLMFKAKYNK